MTRTEWALLGVFTFVSMCGGVFIGTLPMYGVSLGLTFLLSLCWAVGMGLAFYLTITSEP